MTNETKSQDVTAAHAGNIVAAHIQIDHESVVFYYPDHSPREGDSHYHLFNAARKRVLAAGVGCWICGTHENLELHHTEVEFAAAGGVDLEKFAELFPEYHIENEDEFLAWVESEGNLQVLCALHHRGPYNGKHHVPDPNWRLQRIWRRDLPSPVQDPRAATTQVTATTTTVTVQASLKATNTTVTAPAETCAP